MFKLQLRRKVRLFLVAILLCGAPGLHAEDSKDRSVEIYQEHEGNFRAARERDARGSFFDLYEPTILDTEALDLAVAKESWLSKQLIKLRQLLQPSHPIFDFLSTEGKIRYLEELERKLPIENAWDGKTSLLLRKRPRAFPWLSEHPSMEAPPFVALNKPTFWLPEIKTDRSAPARSVREALKRTQDLIVATGMDGLHFHIFIRVGPEVLEKQSEALMSALLRYNERVFLEEAERSSATALSTVLQPWQSKHSARATEILKSKSTEAYAHNIRNDSTDPKETYIALRYWGMEDGQQVLSLELRAGSADLKVKSRLTPIRGLDEGALPIEQRDYSVLELRLTELTDLGKQLAALELIPSKTKIRSLDLESAERVLEEHSKPGKRLSLAQFSAWVLGLKKVPPGLLMAFEQPNEPTTQTFLTQFSDLATIAASRSVREKNGRYLESRFREIFRVWARDTRLQRFKPSPHSFPKPNCRLDLLVK
jgi:hypothetical protein